MGEGGDSLIFIPPSPSIAYVEGNVEGGEGVKTILIIKIWGGKRV